ncbi:hypothetical protein OH77DRAFT_1426924 [Trametes cingulata]|nr:hypothetical protein OH77DRAFT_1426924 [Trametes cingulata]
MEKKSTDARTLLALLPPLLAATHPHPRRAARRRPRPPRQPLRKGDPYPLRPVCRRTAPRATTQRPPSHHF